MSLPNSTRRAMPGHRKAFLLALGVSTLLFLPFVIQDGGCFFYVGDFNLQQIPFYQVAHEAVRSGAWGWSWVTDLGANFIGSYSFYLLFSPFFWLTVPFPTTAIPYLMAPLLALKFAVAALCAFLYLRRMVEKEHSAILGALLYAFSGYMLQAIFFNMFLDVAAFFPLLLLGLELLVTERRRGVFALAVALNAVVNYWCFAGEAVFLLLYFLVRSISPGWSKQPRAFWRAGLEAMLGVGLAGVVLIPSALAVMGIPRAGELLTGLDLLRYSEPQRLLFILGSLFLPAFPINSAVYPDRATAIASVGVFLPLFGAAGGIAYGAARRRDWLTRLLLLLLVMALVPGLNALFSGLNVTYYARWFYMPALLLALATVRALEDKKISWKPGLVVSMVAIVAFPILHSLAKGKNTTYMQLPIGLCLAGAALGLFALWLCLRQRDGPRFSRRILWAAMAMSLLLGYSTLLQGRQIEDKDRTYLTETMLPGREQLTLPEAPFGRAEFFTMEINTGMYWDTPSIQSFHSIVPPSVTAFYQSLGIERRVDVRPGVDRYPLRALLSVRWLVIPKEVSEQSPMPGYTYHSTQLGCNIYENQRFLPVGFAYDRSITQAQFDTVPEEKRERLLLRGLLPEGSDFEDILNPLTEEEIKDLRDPLHKVDIANRQAMGSYALSVDKAGFTSRIRLEQELPVFYSVPWEQGWSATVDGTPTEILRANVGFMTVRVPAGDHEIRFTYRTPGLLPGKAVSAVSALLLALWIMARRLKQQHPLGEFTINHQEKGE